MAGLATSANLGMLGPIIIIGLFAGFPELAKLAIRLPFERKRRTSRAPLMHFAETANLNEELDRTPGAPYMHFAEILNNVDEKLDWSLCMIPRKASY